ncbi:TonB family protein [Carboxylicivirga taeanensis]|uniref:energy transducer TonB n=1 Tax=Carboxylicivirga taeanensis TaxID=1416875 RepID=UPI003F6E2442
MKNKFTLTTIILFFLINTTNVIGQIDTIYRANNLGYEIGKKGNGGKQGVWKTYTSEGKLIAISEYQNGLKHGERIWYYDSGKICSKEIYKNNHFKKGTYWDKEGNEVKQYDIIEKPEYPGGLDSLRSFINRNLTYPLKAQSNGVQGKVYVEFVLSKDGNITNPKVVRTPSELLNEEAIRVVSLANGWKPGKLHGESVEVTFTIPIKFVLN